MKKILILLAILGIFGGCIQQEPLVGGDEDEHGCKPSAGYSWCEERQKCLRPWEEPCTAQDAIEIAKKSNCTDAGNLTENVFYNNNSKTWWIDIDGDREGCAPACVVSDNGSVEVNWRCTGLIE
ncbi:hypothetical protein JXA56_05725 [Candidatus Micrarchaeota archaeon]|nr:hypothetical protein [Candidatus Micrarchaeota archaeon]